MKEVFITERKIVDQYAEQGIKPIDIKFNDEFKRVMWVFDLDEIMTNDN